MEEIARALRDLDEKRVLALVEEALANGVAPVQIVGACNQGMTEVGDLFAAGKYFISQLLFSAEILKSVMNRLDPILENGEKKDSEGKVILGTVKGDIHDIGKNIVSTLLRGAGFEVILNTFTRILCIVLFVLIGYNLIGAGREFRLAGEVSPTMQLPFFPIAYGVGICCFIECLVFLFDIVKIWKAQNE
ncbi:MAG: hypothetical protein CVU64_06080 [Deltaproteobacteria bacterium HGW-Deltaproteobacteria-21]|nr:MAG: hypothetical protein CVU64_06080 [Deltaproteobacteria bacterium HGW-Deltaproteobacteria-21]